jgi:hypothetical protein
LISFPSPFFSNDEWCLIVRLQKDLISIASYLATIYRVVKNCLKISFFIILRADEFITEQEGWRLEYTVYNQVSNFLAKIGYILDLCTPDELDFLYKGVIAKLYYSIDYQPDIHAFYQQIQAHWSAYTCQFIFPDQGSGNDH